MQNIQKQQEATRAQAEESAAAVLANGFPPNLRRLAIVAIGQDEPPNIEALADIYSQQNLANSGVLFGYNWTGTPGEPSPTFDMHVTDLERARAKHPELPLGIGKIAFHEPQPIGTIRSGLTKMALGLKLHRDAVCIFNDFDLVALPPDYFSDAANPSNLTSDVRCWGTPVGFDHPGEAPDTSYDAPELVINKLLYCLSEWRYISDRPSYGCYTAHETSLFCRAADLALCETMGEPTWGDAPGNEAWALVQNIAFATGRFKNPYRGSFKNFRELGKQFDYIPGFTHGDTLHSSRRIVQLMRASAKFKDLYGDARGFRTDGADKFRLLTNDQLVELVHQGLPTGHSAKIVEEHLEYFGHLNEEEFAKILAVPRAQGLIVA